MNPSMSRNEKSRKYAPLNINNVFKGKSVEPQNKTSYRLGGMQNIGKVSNMRRVPPPRWFPSLKAESGAEKNSALSPTTNVSTWPQSQTTDSDERSEQITDNSKSGTGIKTQWNTKSNKPFFLIGQEFPSLQSEGSQESSQDSNAKETTKSDKSKSDDCKNRDNNISLSTLNRIDALSISKSSKGDIAATGWAAENDDPNFEEKLIFSDEESINEQPNWHSDDDVGKLSDRTQQEKSEQSQIPVTMDMNWQDNINFRYSQYHALPYPVSMQNQYLTNQIGTSIISRSSTSPGTNACDDQNMYTNNSVVEQRNARNMEYIFAIERARQKKSNRGCVNIIEDQSQHEGITNRSRLTSVASDTNETMNPPIEPGPPGGPPLIHHMHKSQLQPQIPQSLMTPNILLPQLGNSSVLRFQQQPTIVMPYTPMSVEQQINDENLYKKWVEFLKQQTNVESQDSNIITNDKPASNIYLKVDSKGFSSGNEFTETPKESLHQNENIVSEVEKESKTEEKKPESIQDNNPDMNSKDIRKTKQITKESTENDLKKINKNKYKDYRTTKSYKDNYGSRDADYEYFDQDDDNAAYKDYSLYKQRYSQDKGRRSYRRNNYTYYIPDSYHNQSDYYYKSNSLKMKSKGKDSGKPAYGESYPTENEKKTSNDSPVSKQVEEILENNERKGNKDNKKLSQSQTSRTGVQRKFRDDPRSSYKERSNETQEYSMGFAVNPKERSYYTNNYRSQRYYSGYSYYNYQNAPSNPKYDYQDYYYSDYYYENDNTAQYPHKHSKRNRNTDNWRCKEETTNRVMKQKPESSNQIKPNNRNNRKTDKRQSSTQKDGNFENDVDEWETASEGGSIRSNSISIDGQKKNYTSREKSLNYENKKSNKNSSRCNSGNNTTRHMDDDDNNQDGSSNKQSRPIGNRNFSNTPNSDLKDNNQNRSNDDSKQNESKKCINNNNVSNCVKNKFRLTDYIELSNTLIVNADKLPEVTEAEELLYDNTEQFKEVLSKSTKKTRKLEEQKKIKEQNERKLKEAQINKKTNWENNKVKRRNDTKRDINGKFEKRDNKKMENLKASTNRSMIQEGSHFNSFRTWENSKVSMSIGSWDNTLADNIVEKKAPPKPIGTPASINGTKPKSIPVKSTCQEKQTSIENSESISNVYQTPSSNSEMDFGPSIPFSISNSIFNSDSGKTENSTDQSSDRKLRDTMEFDLKSRNCEKACVIKGNDQQTLDDKINSVKTIWDTQKDINSSTVSTCNHEVVPSTTSNNTICTTQQDISLPTTTISIPNVCKVKPQQQDLSKRDQDFSIVPYSNLLTTHNPTNFLSNTRLHQDYSLEQIQGSEAMPIFTGNQSTIPFNYGIANSHMFESPLMQQNSQDMISNKIGLFNQNPSSFYPSQVPTPKLTNAAQIPPVNYDISNAQLLLTRQNSLSSLIQPNHMHLPLFQSGHQTMQAQTPLFQTPLLGPSNFSSQFPQAHHGYPGHQAGPPPTAFQAPNHHPQPPPPPTAHQHQLLLSHQSQQQLLANHPMAAAAAAAAASSQERVINSVANPTAPAVLNSILTSGQGTMSTEIASANVPDFVTSQLSKPLSNSSILPHGINGSAFMLPHNLNILMKPSILSHSNPQFNSYAASLATNHPIAKSTFDSGPHLKPRQDGGSVEGLGTDGSGIPFLSEVNTVFASEQSFNPLKSNEEYSTVPMSINHFDPILQDGWLQNKVEINPTLTQNSHPVLTTSIEKSLCYSPSHTVKDNSRHFTSVYRDNPNLMMTGFSTIANSNINSSVRSNKQSFSVDSTSNASKSNNSNNSSKIYENSQSTSKANNYSNKSENIETNIRNSFKNKEQLDNMRDRSLNETVDIPKIAPEGRKQRLSNSDNYGEKCGSNSWSFIDEETKDKDRDRGKDRLDDGNSRSQSQQKSSGKSPQQHQKYMDNQYGYDETRLSSQTAESLARYGPNQLRQVIMQLREGPVMTDGAVSVTSTAVNTGNSTDVNYSSSITTQSGDSGNSKCEHHQHRNHSVMPRMLMPTGSGSASTASSRMSNQTISHRHSDSDHLSHKYSATLGFVSSSPASVYQRNRALTPPGGIPHIAPAFASHVATSSNHYHRANGTTYHHHHHHYHQSNNSSQMHYNRYTNTCRQNHKNNFSQNKQQSNENTNSGNSSSNSTVIATVSSVSDKTPISTTVAVTSDSSSNKDCETNHSVLKTVLSEAVSTNSSIEPHCDNLIAENVM